MANLAKIEINVYSNASGTTQVGQTVVNLGSDTSIFIDDTALNDTISSGDNYWVKARVTDTLNRTSYWSPLAKVVTRPGMELTAAPNNMEARIWMDLYYNLDALDITQAGIMLSTDPDGAGAISIPITLGEFTTISFSEDDTDYYMVGWCDDSLGRHNVQDWNDSILVTSGFNAPDVSFMNVDAASDEIEGILRITASNLSIPLNGVWILLYDDSNNLLNRIKLNDLLGLQTFTFQDGNTDYDGTTITISPDTNYKLVADVSYTYDGVRIEYIVHTAIEPTSSITLTVSNVTSNSAYITWLVEGNSSLQPTVTVYIYGGGNYYYPQVEEDYGQWSFQLNGLQSGVTYTVYGEVEVAGQDWPGTDTKYFTTL